MMTSSLAYLFRSGSPSSPRFHLAEASLFQDFESRGECDAQTNATWRSERERFRQKHEESHSQVFLQGRIKEKKARITSVFLSGRIVGELLHFDRARFGRIVPLPATKLREIMPLVEFLVDR